MRNFDLKRAPRALQSGVTLIELMIGVLLGLIILSAISFVFTGSVGSYRQQESISVIQESGRIAMELLGRDIRMAGNPGCGNLTALEHKSPTEFSGDLALTPAPDSVTIVRGSSGSSAVTTSPSVTQVELADIGALGALAAGDKILLSDCVFTDVMTVASVAGSTVTGTPVSKQYPPGARVTRLETITYTVAGGELLRNGQAIGRSVTGLAFYYGIDDTGTRSANRYESAPAATDIGNIVSVKLTLGLADGTPPVTKTFSSTVALRNRAP